MENHFNIETPIAKPFCWSDNPAYISGWFVDLFGRPAKCVRVRNGLSYHPCAIQERPDVVSAFRERWPEMSSAVGFYVEVPTGFGLRRLVIEAETVAGDRVDLGQRLIWMRLYRSRDERLAMPGDDEVFPTERQSGPTQQPDVKAIAFYLPQFHSIPENNAWWGHGFTEWTNVRPARPQFDEHYQPHIPHDDVGYYDLTDAAVLERQARMARSAGIYGFCFYYYWFAGKRLLERPLEQLLQSGRPAMPFCFCWANENWSRRWDGYDSEVLIAQAHSPEDDEAVIRDLARAFRDSRYIRVNGRPLLLLYRPALLPDPAATATRWRAWCRRDGIGEIHLAGVRGFGCNEPAPFGLDSLVEFPPNDSGAQPLSSTEVKEGEQFAGKLYDYRQVRANCLSVGRQSFRLFRGVMPSWDNTARRKHKGAVYLRSSPAAFANWLRRAVELTRDCAPDAERFLFINAWNEWAEGCHLEPDERYGYAWLNATNQVLGSWATLPPVTRNRVLFISHDFARAGAQLFLLRLLMWLSKNTVLTFDLLINVDASRERGASAPELDLLSRFRELCPVYFVSTKTGLPENFERIQKREYQLVYANTSTLGDLVGGIKIDGIPVITHVHELSYWIEKRMPAGAIQKLDALTDTFIACSKAVADNLIQRQRVPATKVEIIHAYTSLARAAQLATESSPTAARLALGIPPETFLVVACGTLDWRKGPDLLLDAVINLRKLAPSLAIKILWLGGKTDVDGVTDLEDRILNHDLGDVFVLQGVVGNPLEYMLAADCFALPSREDPFPLVMLEAASLERPMVAFHESGGAPELLADGAGLLAPHGDVNQFAICLARIAADREFAQALGAEARRRVSQKYCEEVLAPRIHRLIETSFLGRPTATQLTT
jgi:glycosyltransferase involved in cell wall biosynthesis